MALQSYDAERASFLASEILKHKRLYYRGTPAISDASYDLLEDELRRIAPDHPVLAVVGIDVPESSNPKVTHDRPMLSLGKTYSKEDLLSWVGTHEVVGTLKVDGSSMSIVYRSGAIHVAKTRGNGREGEDVTSKIRWVSDVIPKVEGADDFEIRGELYCTESQFVKLAQEMERLGLERPTSPRNIVAGVLGRKLHGDLARFFNFFAFEVLGVSSFKTEVARCEWLEKRGFRLPHAKLLKTHADVEDYLEHIKRMIEEDEVGCDGAVFTYNDLALHEELGVTSHHPRYKNSFKWQGETAQSRITRIDWATSRLGIVTPVAVIEPVVLSGAKITNITLHNAAHVRTYHLKVGDTIELVRSGEVIPKFLSVVNQVPGDAELPIHCPSCRTNLVSDDVRMKCPAVQICPAQQSGIILNWIRCASIDDLSEKRLQALIDIGLVRSVPDLYRLTPDDFLKLPSTKEKMAQKLFKNIQASLCLPLPQFLNGLGIEGAGLTTWEKIVSEHPKLAEVRSLAVEDLIAIEGFAMRSATQIVEGLHRSKPLIDQLLSAGLKPQEGSIRQETSNALAGMQFVITGTLSRPRSEIEEMIKAAGGKLGSTVTKNTSVLVTNEQESTSSKMQKAKQLGVPMWTEEELLGRVI